MTAGVLLFLLLVAAAILVSINSDDGPGPSGSTGSRLLWGAG